MAPPTPLGALLQHLRDQIGTHGQDRAVRRLGQIAHRRETRHAAQIALVPDIDRVGTPAVAAEVVERSPTEGTGLGGSADDRHDLRLDEAAQLCMAIDLTGLAGASHDASVPSMSIC